MKSLNSFKCALDTSFFLHNPQLFILPDVPPRITLIILFYVALRSSTTSLNSFLLRIIILRSSNLNHFYSLYLKKFYNHNSLSNNTQLLITSTIGPSYPIIVLNSLLMFLNLSEKTDSSILLF